MKPKNIIPIYLVCCVLSCGSDAYDAALCESDAYNTASAKSSLNICVNAEKEYARSQGPSDGEYTMKRGPRSEQFEDIIEGFLRGEIDSGAATAYVTSVVGLAIIPILCCLGNGFCGITHCLARTCCEFICPAHCLLFMCRPNPKRPYEKKDKLVPLMILFLCGMAACITALSGIGGGTGRFENTYIRGACLVDTTRVRVTSFISEFQKPVKGFKGSFNTISADVASRLGTVSEIEVAMANLTKQYSDLKIASAYQSGESPTERTNNECVALQGIETAAVLAQEQTITAATSFTNTMNATSISVNNTLVGFRSTINEAINNADALAENLKAQVDTSLNLSSDAVLQLARYMKRNPNLTSGTAFALFGWIFLLAALFVIGFILILLNSHQHEIKAGQVRSNKKLEGKILDVGHVGSCGARCGAFAWCFVFVFGAISSGVGIPFLPFSYVFTDICVISETLPLKLGSLMQPATTTPSASTETSNDSEEESGGVVVPNLNVNQLMTTCWNGGGIYDALNMKDTIPINTTSMFAGIEAVPLDGQLDDTEFLNLKSIVNNDLNDCSTGQLRMQTHISMIEEANEVLEAEIAAYSTLLADIQENSAEVLEAQVDKIRCVKCDFIKSTWQDLFVVLCKDARGSFSTIANAATSIGVFSCFTGMAMLIVLRRWAGHGPLKAHDHGDDGLQLAMTRKLEKTCGCLSHHRSPVREKYAAAHLPETEMAPSAEVAQSQYASSDGQILVIQEKQDNLGSTYAVMKNEANELPEVEGELI